MNTEAQSCVESMPMIKTKKVMVKKNKMMKKKEEAEDEKKKYSMSSEICNCPHCIIYTGKINLCEF